MSPEIVVSGKDTNRYELTPLEASIGAAIETIVENNITITCPATGLPRPSLTWRRSGDLQPLVSGGRLMIKDQTLTILKGQERDSGEYLCTATNLQGSATVYSKVSVIGENIIFL